MQSVERRALRMAEIAVGQREEALELVQDAMLKLAEKYAHKSAEEWGPLFQRILQSRIRDWYRRTKVMRRVITWWHRDTGDDQKDAQPELLVADEQAIEPPRELASEQFATALTEALQSLPLRQRQVFLLRVWEGLSVKQTAAAIGCGDASVKTHYFRALQTLRGKLAEHTDS